jgi:hypothetical protein
MSRCATASERERGRKLEFLQLPVLPLPQILRVWFLFLFVVAPINSLSGRN